MSIIFVIMNRCSIELTVIYIYYLLKPNSHIQCMIIELFVLLISLLLYDCAEKFCPMLHICMYCFSIDILRQKFTNSFFNVFSLFEV